MEIHIPYGHSSRSVSIPDRYVVDIIEAPVFEPAEEPEKVVWAALDGLLGDVKWSDFSGARSVAIAINDKTRPVPHHQLLPPLLERLASIGIPDEAIRFYIAGGTHPPMSPNEYPAILPARLLERYQVVPHDPEAYDKMESLGKTGRGTPVWIDRDYLQSDLKIVVGNIEPHQFAGFSGGVKSAAIGLAGLKTINQNHSLMTHPDSLLGGYDANPARQDIEEIGRKIGIQLTLNAILNMQRQIVHVLAGQPVAVMLAGLPLSRQVCQAVVRQRYSLLISSPGGHPKDINLYQAQKGLGHAALIARPGATIILVAACPEGTGSSHYEAWMRDKHSYADVLQSFAEEGFRVGPHKGFQIARDASRGRLMFYSEMDMNLARALLLNPVRDLQSALDLALANMQPGERVGVMPHASSTIPHLME
jgi:nickel-dependent lactate racemase